MRMDGRYAPAANAGKTLFIKSILLTVICASSVRLFP